jgi:DNA-binding FadR family transcriptional regulator
MVDNGGLILLIADRFEDPQMTTNGAATPLVSISTNERATPSLVYRALLRSLQEGMMVPGAKLPNERDLAQQLNTSRTAVRSALAIMEREGLVHRRVGAGTFLADDALSVFERMDQTSAASHDDVPSFGEIVEGRLLFEPAMMLLVVNRVQDRDIAEMRGILDDILGSPTWEDFKESIYALHRAIFATTRNKFLVQIMNSILDDRRAVLFDGHDTDKPAPDLVKRQTHKDLSAIVDAIAERNGKRAEELVNDHLMRTLATINIWQ